MGSRDGWFGRTLVIGVVAASLGLASCGGGSSSAGEVPGAKPPPTIDHTTPFELAGPGAKGSTTLPDSVLGVTTTGPATTTTTEVETDPVCIANQTIIDATLMINPKDPPARIRTEAVSMAEAMKHAIELISPPSVKLDQKAGIVALFGRMEVQFRQATTYDQMAVASAMSEQPSGGDAAAVNAFTDYTAKRCPIPSTAR